MEKNSTTFRPIDKGFLLVGFVFVFEMALLYYPVGLKFLSSRRLLFFQYLGQTTGTHPYTQLKSVTAVPVFSIEYGETQKCW